MTDLRVLVVDDQQLVREGLTALLGLMPEVSVVGSAADGAEGVRLAAELEPDVVLMDLRMPVLDGIAATERISREHPDIAVVALTTYDDDHSIGSALRAGACGYLTKDAGRAEIAAALRSAAAGQSTYSRSVSARLVDVFAASAADPRPDSGPGPGADSDPGARSEPIPDELTPREVEVLTLIAEGLPNAEIAARLYIGTTTVKTHVNNVFGKLGIRNRAEAVRYAHRHGLAP